MFATARTRSVQAVSVQFEHRRGVEIRKKSPGGFDGGNVNLQMHVDMAIEKASSRCAEIPAHLDPYSGVRYRTDAISRLNHLWVSML